MNANQPICRREPGGFLARGEVQLSRESLQLVGRGGLL